MDFDAVFARLLEAEGGYVNDPNDPGGETKFGISKRSYPNLNIATLTIDDARDIYKRDFWDIARMDSMPPAVAFQLFDFAVNSGMSTAIRKLQAAIGVADDGYFGAQSWGAMARFSESDIVMRLNAQRLRYMTNLKNWQNHGKGWARRICDNLEYAAGDTDV